MTMLKNCFIVTNENKEEDGDWVRDLVEMTVKKMDKDRDGKISYSDFYSSVTEEPLLLEAFGTCLPTSLAGIEFLNKVLDKK